MSKFKILNVILYFCIFYIIASIIKIIYMFFIDIFGINRIVIGHFYLDEIVISILVIVFMIKDVRVVGTKK